MPKKKPTAHITQSAKDTPCVRCGSTGNVCARHYNGLRQHQYGKGRGIKASDLASADLCDECDAEFTEGVNIIDGERAGKSIARSEEFLHLCMLSNIRRYQDGVFG